MRGRRGGEWSVEYPARAERPLTDVLPRSGPAAVLVYGLDGTCRALCLDLDVTAGSVQAVEADAARLERWLVECGARVVTDVSPIGGRHLYVPLAERLPYETARELVEALALLFPTLDPGPHRSVRSGCIRTPGALHKTGGHQQLTMSLNGAYDVLRRPNPPDVVEAMAVRLRPQIAAWRSSLTTAAISPTDAPANGSPGRSDAPLGVPARGVRDAILRIAQHGTYDTARYPTASEARAAVMAAAARAGWTLHDVVARLEDGRWAGLAALYAHHRDKRRRITVDWAAAQRLVTATKRTTPQVKTDNGPGNDTVRISNTSGPESQGGRVERAVTSPGDLAEEHQFIRTWRAALRTTEQHRFPGRAGHAIRFVLRELGAAAHMTGSRYVAFGVRSIAVGAGMDYSTVSRALKQAVAAGWCDVLEPARGEKADLYALTIPQDLAGRVEQLRWDSGRLHALRPAFRALGHVAAFVFEALENDRADTVAGLASATGISRSTVHEATQALLAWGLVTRDDAGRLHAHPEYLLAVAEQLGALDVVAAQLRTYARQRMRWRAYLHRHGPEAAPADLDHSPDPDDLAWLNDTGWWLPPDADANDVWSITAAVQQHRVA